MINIQNNCLIKDDLHTKTQFWLTTLLTKRTSVSEADARLIKGSRCSRLIRMSCGFIHESFEEF